MPGKFRKRERSKGFFACLVMGPDKRVLSVWLRSQRVWKCGAVAGWFGMCRAQLRHNYCTGWRAAQESGQGEAKKQEMFDSKRQAWLVHASVPGDAAADPNAWTWLSTMPRQEAKRCVATLRSNWPATLWTSGSSPHMSRTQPQRHRHAVTEASQRQLERGAWFRQRLPHPFAPLPRTHSWLFVPLLHAAMTFERAWRSDLAIRLIRLRYAGHVPPGTLVTAPDTEQELALADSLVVPAAEARLLQSLRESELLPRSAVVHRP